MSKSLRDLYLRSSEILHNWQEVVLVFRYDSSFLLCESCKTSQRATAVTNICQSERVIWPTRNIFFSCPTNQQLRHGFTPGQLSTDAAPGRDSASLIWQRLTQRRRQRSLNLAGGRRRRGGLGDQLIEDDVDRCRRLLATIVTRQRVTRKVCKAVVKMHIKYF